MGCGTSSDAEIVTVDPSKLDNLKVSVKDQKEQSEVKEVSTVMSPRFIEDIIQLKVQRASFIMEREDKFDEHYKILEEIGRGAYGVVYTAKHKETGDIRAVKVVKMKDGRSNNETSILKDLVTSSNNIGSSFNSSST